ncbi:MAG: hypothetical protein ACLVCU_05790 [Gallintestinimicrobium sp.]|uniref:hypothetical protein n=1 Tax=Gallintestinimicrobium sp. TaxID=2981655 RepID=UPI00399A6D0F
MKRKKLTASMIALVMSVSLPMTTYAANWYLEDGSVTVNADNSGQTVTQGSGSAVPDEAPVITQRESSVETGNTITINAAENATANVTISDVNINTSGKSGKSEAAVSTNGKGNVNIELDGTNTLKSGRNHAGLEKNSDGNQGKLTITDENENGKLIATGGSDAAGIGGGYCGDGNDITIAGGKVTATGGNYGAGIGGGGHGNGKNITITDGEVTAIGGLNGAGIGGGLRNNGEKITVSGDATLKVQGGPTDAWDGAGAGIGNGGYITEELTPVNGAETEPDTSNLTTGKIEYYAPGADMTKDKPTSTTLGSRQPEPASPGETAAPVEYRMQTSASEPVQGNGKSTGYKAPVQGHFYQVVGQDGKTMIFATAQKKDVLAIATDSDFAMLTGKMEDIEALRKQGVRRIIFATKRATSTFLLSELLEKRAYGEIWSLIHDGENVAFTAVEKKMDISSILTRLQTK